MAEYNSISKKAEEFINDAKIRETLAFAEAHKDDLALMNNILEKGREYRGLSYAEAATLLECEDPDIIRQIFELGKEIKEHFYGNRIVMFAPLYLSNYCVNGCVYCPYHGQNKTIPRKKLSRRRSDRKLSPCRIWGTRDLLSKRANIQKKTQSSTSSKASRRSTASSTGTGPSAE